MVALVVVWRVVVFLRGALAATRRNLDGRPPLLLLALVAEEQGFYSQVLFHDYVHLQVELLVFRGQPVNVGLQVLVHLVKPAKISE